MAAHPSPITSFILHLFLALFPSLSCLLEPDFLLVCGSELGGLFSFMEPQQIKDIPGNMERSSVCCEGTGFTVYPQNIQLLFLPQQAETKHC